MRKGKKDRRGAKLGPCRKAVVDDTEPAWHGVKKRPVDEWPGRRRVHSWAYWEQQQYRREPPGTPANLGKCRELKQKAKECPVPPTIAATQMNRVLWR